jgi:hypothetical protein
MVNLRAEEVLKAKNNVFIISNVLSLETDFFISPSTSLFLFLSLKSRAHSPKTNPIAPNK